MSKVLIFAGTTEGRKLAEYLDRQRVEAHVCVATEYGEKLLPVSGNLSVSHERLDQDEMAALIQELKADPVIDATHPYAALVTQNIQSACDKAGVSYIRLLRSSAQYKKVKLECEGPVYVDSVKEAVEYLEHTQGNILVTTGSKEIEKFTHLTNYQERVFARVLSLPNVAAECAAMGFEGKHLICMQGPFSKELNAAMLKQLYCRYLVTKESGTTGGFLEKYEAALESGCNLVIVGRPAQEVGLSLEECKKYLQDRLRFHVNPHVTLAGIGMGQEKTMTVEARRACEKADCIIGAKRMVEGVQNVIKGTSNPGVFYEYESDKIVSYIKKHPQYEKIVIALSGDVGFYSGAKKLIDKIKEQEGWSVSIICGISSVAYFMSKIKKSWEDAVVTSNHGKKSNLISLIKYNEKVFSIMGTKDGISELASKLCEYHLDDAVLYVGEQLSYPGEKIRKGSPREFVSYEADPLSVVYIENRNWEKKVVTAGIPDGKFLRDKVPMTKEEVRSISIAKLRLHSDSVCYDVGAGTGAVSVEMAMQALEGKVYAIEKKPMAVELLFQNKMKFQADHLTVVEGLAPQAMEPLEAPTHAFIGGSSGNLNEIMSLLLAKNPGVRIVINCIALETIAEAVTCMKELSVCDVDIVQVAVGKSKNVGSYHMMMGENPIYIISCTGRKGEAYPGGGALS